MIRVPPELWVMALIRRCGAAGAPAVVVRRGNSDAGVVFVKIALLNGRAKLFGPAPSALSGDGMPRLEPHLDPAGADEAAVDAYLARQTAFDSDLWIVEIEDKAGRDFLDF